MSMERLLALIKDVTPTMKRKPRAARVIQLGHLTQHLLRHRQMGRADHRGVVKRADLEGNLKVHLPNIGRNRPTAKGSVRWHFRYANEMVKKHIAEH